MQQSITNYEQNIIEIEKIIDDIGTDKITVQQKEIINKYLPDQIKSTAARKPSVQRALKEIQQKLEEKRLQLRNANLKGNEMTSNPAFEPPSTLDLPPAPKTAGGGGPRK